MSEHTPGPWELYIGAGSKGYAGNYEIMAAVDTEHEANARLIRAAPELLEACEEAHEWFRRFTQNSETVYEDESRMLVLPEAAIARVK